MTEYSLRGQTPLKRHRVFYRDVAVKSLELTTIKQLAEMNGVNNGDVVIFADNYFLVLGVTGKLHSCLPEKSALIVTQKTNDLLSLINFENVILSWYPDGVRKFSVTFKIEEITVEDGKLLVLLNGPANEVFRDCCLIKKRFDDSWITYSKANCTFSKIGYINYVVTEEKSQFEVAKFLLRRQILTDIWLAMCPLELPDYVMLEIVDWLELLFYDDHREKIALIQGLSRSRRKIKGIER
jgi:hypothetical protein